ncbi:RDD family protein [Microbacterium gorillae]|uniref:RDD family protein n=1 Tax=Microbacterium gorillae TaxID=1231063 RepID=UPI000591323C|nr:RDD family protein [Microbacterium gorillae]
MSVAVVAVKQDEILTGEAVALDVQPLGLIMRSVGAVIDMVIGYVLLLLLSLLGAWLAGAGILTEGSWGIYQIAAIVFCFVVLPVGMETATRGRSLGKLAMGGRIVRADGGATGFRHAFLRGLLGILEIYMTFGGLAFLVGVFTPRAQRLGDLAAGTYCERTRTPAVPESTLFLPPMLAEWANTADVGRLPVRLARRMSQFAAAADGLAPGARHRLAGELATEAAPFVSPVPPVDPESFVRGVLVVRRDREFRALELQNRRTATLLAGTD